MRVASKLPRRLGVLIAMAWFACALSAVSQTLGFSAPPAQDGPAVEKAVRALADRLAPDYRDPDRQTYLRGLLRLQLAGGHYAEAVRSAEALEALPVSIHAQSAFVRYRIYALAKLDQARSGADFATAYGRSFRNVFARLDDAHANHVLETFGGRDPVALAAALEGLLKRQAGKTQIAAADALQLISAFDDAAMYRAAAPLAEALTDEEDGRRYVIARDIVVKTRDGGTICALVIRARDAPPRSTILEFTIYADAESNLDRARTSASRGYVGVIGLTRGKGCSPDKPIPFEHDGADAATLIDWIAAQPWSDGRVAMFGGSYSGFTSWAAAKYRPKALKAIMVGAPEAPGIDAPMEGNIFWNFLYPCPFYTTDNKTLDNATYNQSERWQKLDHDWYVSGRPYRDLDKIDGVANPFFDTWVSHGAYDGYWQAMIPQGKAFAQPELQVLMTAGYYFGGPGSAAWYLSQREKNGAAAATWLLIGPYDHFIAQRGTTSSSGAEVDEVAGLRLDPAAHVDMVELAYAWFDHVLKGKPRPPILADHVNYQVPGANVWRHAPSLAAISPRTLRFHLTSRRVGQDYRLAAAADPQGSVSLSVDLADRKDANRESPGGNVVDKAIDPWNGLTFVSDPIAGPMEMNGLFSGRLDFVANKKDFDFQISLFALTPAGDYVQLAPYWSRASFVADIRHRQLLTPGARTRLDFRAIRLMSFRLQPGSRLVAVLNVVKEPGRQINFGSGKAVADESIADAGPPLTIRWFGDSYIEVPVRPGA